MKRKLLIALVVLVVIGAAAAAAGLVVPTPAHAERTVTMNASPADILPDISSLKAWNEWSAWNTRDDPKWKPAYTGPESGVGAASSWTESESGGGSQKITAADLTGVSYVIDVA